MELEVITPEKTVFSGKVKLVQLPGSSGSFEILKNHAPIISTLMPGNLRIVPQRGDALLIPVSAGVVEQSGNKVIVLVEKA